ncbi:WD repeat, SAM and U-box domain-containing protein 1-like [Brachionichthys hirsutus]|uniref:WD repeat, SAM and U-box domain-containing protein 1-like n=1 Tax=Brachionichthys hirsutus TaxID=412623 RepID=UPI0036049DF4
MASHAATLAHHSDEVSCCAFSPSLLATASGDKTIRVYRAADFSQLPFSPLSGHGYGVRCCCFSPSGGVLLSCSADGRAILWSSETGAVVATLEHPQRSALRVCAFAPDSSFLLAGASDGSVALWSASCRTLHRCSAAGEASIVACSFSPCSQMFVSGCSGGDLRLWDTDVNLLHAEKDAHDLGVTCCSFARQFDVDGSCVEFRLASCGQDSHLKVWIVSQHGGAACVMRLLHTLTSQSAPVLCCAFSADGELLLSGSMDKSVAIYDAHSGTLRDTLKQHDRYVTAVALSPNMPWIATGSTDRTVNVWRMQDGVGTAAADLRDAVCQEQDSLNWLHGPSHH